MPLQSPPSRRAVVLFVHGLFGDNDSWGRFPDLLAADESVRESYDLAFYAYRSPKPLLSLNPLKRVPSILDLAEGLATFLRSTLDGYQRLVLVGHSMGGLVILRYLAEAVRESRARELARIAAVVMFATPNHGSDFGRRLREQLRGFWRSPQEAALRPLERETQRTLSTVVRHIDQARGLDDGRCPIRLVACAGTDDGIVTSQSVQSVFRHTRTLNGKDHSNIIDPPDQEDVAYKVLWQELQTALERELPGEARQPHRATSELTTVVTGGKIFLESSLLGEIMAQAIEHDTPAGVGVDRRFDIGETSETYQRLVNGRIHLYAEYTGTLLHEIVELPGFDIEEERRHTAEWIQKLLDERAEYQMLRVGPLFGLDNSYVLVMSEDRAAELGVDSISQLQARSAGLTLLAHWSFYRRPDAMKALDRRYGVFAFAKREITAPYGKYEALASGEADVVTGYSTDPEVALGRGSFTALKDDKRVFGHYYALPFYHRRILDRVPELPEALQRLGGRVGTTQMARLIDKARNRGLGAGEMSDPQKYDLHRLVQEFLGELGLFDGETAAERPSPDES